MWPEQVDAVAAAVAAAKPWEAGKAEVTRGMTQAGLRARVHT